MNVAHSNSHESWQNSTSHMVLEKIFSSSTSVVVWERPESEVIQHYFSDNFEALGAGLRNVFNMETLEEALGEALPDGEGKSEVVQDIFLLADMLTCLFGCQEVGLRLTPLNKAMCPKFHVDNIPVRLVTTYLGDGTHWLPTEIVNRSKLGRGAKGLADDKSGLYPDETYIQKMNAFEVALLKGKAWEGHEDMAAVHRSCPVEKDQKRVLLTLDPM